MKALVTGATGFAGSWLVKKLLARGYGVIALSRGKRALESCGNKGAGVYLGDLTNKESLSGLDGDFDYVFHLAAARDSAGHKECYRVNAQGTRNLLETLVEKKARLKKFIYVSSMGVSGLGNDSAPKTEKDAPRPNSIYTQSKLMAEKEIMNRGADIPYIIVRPSKIYGPGDRRILLHFKLVKHGFTPMLGLKQRFLSLCHVEDLSDALLAAAQSPRVNEIYYFCDGQCYSWDEFYGSIARVLRKKTKTMFAPQFANSVMLSAARLLNYLHLRCLYLEPNTFIELKSRYWLCDPSKFFEDFSYRPRFSLDEGMEQTAEWFKKYNLL